MGGIIIFLLLSLTSMSLAGKIAYRGPDAREGASCPTTGNGQFDHPKYCDKYLNCWDGQMVIGQCPSGLVFNQKSGACDYPQNVDCSGREDSRPSIPVSTQCPRPFGTFSSPTDCSQFIVCQAGNATVYSCPDGLYYNSELGVCTYKENANCQEWEYPDESGPNQSSTSDPVPSDESSTPDAPPPAQMSSEPPPQESSPMPDLVPKPSLMPTTSTPLPPMAPTAPSTAMPPMFPILTTGKPRPTMKPQPTQEPAGQGPEGPEAPAAPPSNKPSTTTTPRPTDIDQVLWPAWPNWPTMKCPIIQGFLPVVGDCEAVVVCLGGLGHFFRCPTGHAFDLSTGACGPIRVTQGCSTFFPEQEGEDGSMKKPAAAAAGGGIVRPQVPAYDLSSVVAQGPVRYVYLPLNLAILHQQGNNLNFKR